MQWRDAQGHVDCYQLHQGKRVVDDEEGHHQYKEDGQDGYDDDQNVNPTPDLRKEVRPWGRRADSYKRSCPGCKIT